MRFFAYDYEDGFELFKTLDEARTAAEDSFTRWRELALSEREWPEDTFGVCYGELRGEVVEFTNEDGWIDYRLTEETGDAGEGTDGPN